MIAGAILLGFISMVSYGLANTLALPLARRLNSARLVLLRGLVVCALLAVISLPTLGHMADWRAALGTLALGVLGYVPLLAFTQGIKISRISIVAPIAGTAPLITVLLSVLVLHSHLHSMQWVGVLLIILANAVVSVNFRSLRDSNILKLASGVPYGLVAALLWGVVFFLIIYPTRSIGPWLSALLMEVGVALAAAVHVWLRREAFMLKETRKPSLIWNAALLAAGSLAYTVGVKYFHVGLVAALSNSTAVVSIIAATRLHHERLTRVEKILTAIMVVGVVLISIT